MKNKIKKLVVDSAGFIRNVPLWDYGEEFYCIQDVIREIKDKQTRQLVESLPITLIFKEPSSSSIKFINEFTKKTGDFATLSLVDIKVLALTYELEVEAKGKSHLREQPIIQRTEQVASVRPPDNTGLNSIEGFYLPKKKQSLVSESGHVKENCQESSKEKLESSEEVWEQQKSTNFPPNLLKVIRKCESEYFLVSDSEIISVFNEDDILLNDGSVEEEYLRKYFSNILCKPENACFLIPHLNDLLVTRSFLECIDRITISDVIVLFALLGVPLLDAVYALLNKHRSGEHASLFLRMCLNYPNEFPKSSFQRPGSKQVHSADEIESVKIAREFYEAFSEYPHFTRWLFHMLSYNTNELKEVIYSKDTLEDECSVMEDFILKKFIDISALSKKNSDLCTDNPNSEDDSEILSQTCVSDDVDTEGNTNHLESVKVVNGNECEENNEEDDDGWVTFTKKKNRRNIQNGYANNNSIIRCEDRQKEEGSDKKESESCDYGDEEDYYDDEDDDEEGWITPSNIESLRLEDANDNEERDEADIEVACISGDFAIQNTLKHIGLQIVGVDGKLIKSVRTFILRCHACFKTTNRMEKIFCPNCGNKTLKRVSVTLNPDGTQKIWISTRRPINTRGMKYSLPKPKGGKHGVNPLLVSDQREAQQRATRLGRLKNNPMDEDYSYKGEYQPFTVRDVYSKSAQLGIRPDKNRHRGTFYWEQKNPNAPLKRGTRKKKSIAA